MIIRLPHQWVCSLPADSESDPPNCTGPQTAERTVSEWQDKHHALYGAVVSLPTCNQKSRKHLTFVFTHSPNCADAAQSLVMRRGVIISTDAGIPLQIHWCNVPSREWGSTIATGTYIRPIFSSPPHYGEFFKLSSLTGWSRLVANEATSVYLTHCSVRHRDA